MSGWRLTPEQRARIVRQYNLGISPTETAAEFGVSPANVVQLARRAGYGPREPRKAFKKPPRERLYSPSRKDLDVQEMAQMKRAAGLTFNVSGAAIDKDALRLMARIPSDTRDFTARFCGDP